jgi:glycosyltransferase involved in cell wall biosynthesis
MLGRPFFSILIPTKDKEEYIGLAISSILRQTFRNFEIIISDNSTKKIDKLISSFNDKRIRYYKTSKSLLLTDNWNNAISKTRGRYIILMGDDDYILPSCLRDYYSAIVEYDYPDFLFCNFANFEYSRNKLMIYGKNNGRPTREDASTLLKNAFGFGSFPLSGPSVSCFSKGVCDRVIERVGRLYYGSFPDFFAHNAMIALSNRIVKVNRVNVIFGRTKKSIGELQISGNKKLRAKGFYENPILAETPLSPNLFCDGHYEALLLLKQMFPNIFQSYEINNYNYFLWAGDLVADRFITEPTTSTQQIFWKFVSKAPLKVSLRLPLMFLRRLVLHVYLTLNFERASVGKEHSVFVSSNLRDISSCASFLKSKGY